MATDCDCAYYGSRERFMRAAIEAISPLLHGVPSDDMSLDDVKASRSSTIPADVWKAMLAASPEKDNG